MLARSAFLVALLAALPSSATAASNGGSQGGTAPPVVEHQRGLEPLLERLRGDGPWQPAPPLVEADGYRYRARGRVGVEPRPGWRPQLRLDGEWLASADLGGSPGRLETRRFELDAAAVRGERDSGWRIEVGAEISEYRFRGASGLVPNTEAPTEDLALFELGVGHRGRLSEHWGFRVGGGAQLAGEWGADAGDSLTYGGLFSATHDISDDFAWTIGALVRTQLEDGIEAVPIVGVEWTIDERTRLSTPGPRLELARDLEGGFTAFASAGYESRHYRLDDDGPLPDGALRDRAVLALGGLDWNPGFGAEALADTRLRVFAGSAVWREVTFLDDDDTVGRSRLHPGFVAGLAFVVTF